MAHEQEKERAFPEHFQREKRKTEGKKTG